MFFCKTLFYLNILMKIFILTNNDYYLKEVAHSDELRDFYLTLLFPLALWGILASLC